METVYTKQEEYALDYTIRIFRSENKIIPFELMLASYRSLPIGLHLKREEYKKIYNDTVKAVMQ